MFCVNCQDQGCEKCNLEDCSKCGGLGCATCEVPVYDVEDLQPVQLESIPVGVPYGQLQYVKSLLGHVNGALQDIDQLPAEGYRSMKEDLVQMASELDRRVRALEKPAVCQCARPSACGCNYGERARGGVCGFCVRGDMPDNCQACGKPAEAHRLYKQEQTDSEQAIAILAKPEEEWTDVDWAFMFPNAPASNHRKVARPKVEPRCENCLLPLAEEPCPCGRDEEPCPF